MWIKYFLFLEEMKTFEKIIELNSNEHNALKLLKKDVNFLPILHLKRHGSKTVACGWPKLAESFLVKKARKKNTVKMELECWSQVKQQVKLLHEKKINHGDLHFDNIMCGGDKKNESYYIIDFGECSDPKNLTVYEKNALLFNEDLFQFLWNFVFGSNQMQNDFSAFRKLLQKQRMEDQEMVLKRLAKMLFMRIKSRNW